MGAIQKFWSLNYKTAAGPSVSVNDELFSRYFGTYAGVVRFATGCGIGTGSQVVRIYNYDGTNINLETSIPDPAPLVDGFWGGGLLMDSTGTKLLISKPKELTKNYGTTSVGTTTYESPVYLYELILGVWTNTNTIDAPVGAASGFGVSMSSNADLSIVIVADKYYDNKKGRLTYYTLIGGIYTEMQSFMAQSPQVNGKYGDDVVGTTTLDYIATLGGSVLGFYKYDSGTDSYVLLNNVSAFGATQAVSIADSGVIAYMSGFTAFKVQNYTSLGLGSSVTYNVSADTQITQILFSQDQSQLAVAYFASAPPNTAYVNIYDRVGTTLTLNQTLTDAYAGENLYARNFGYGMGFIDVHNAIIIGKFGFPGRVTAFNL